MSDQSRERLEENIRQALPHLPGENAWDLANVLHRLIAALQPEQIYVFGSQARGEATSNSDVDLLLIVSHSDLPGHQRDQMAYHAAGPHLDALDLLVLTREEFERRRSVVASLPATVVREGRTLYAA